MDVNRKACHCKPVIRGKWIRLSFVLGSLPVEMIFFAILSTDTLVDGRLEL